MSKNIFMKHLKQFISQIKDHKIQQINLQQRQINNKQIINQLKFLKTLHKTTLQIRYKFMLSLKQIKIINFIIIIKWQIKQIFTSQQYTNSQVYVIKLLNYSLQKMLRKHIASQKRLQTQKIQQKDEAQQMETNTKSKRSYTQSYMAFMNKARKLTINNQQILQQSPIKKNIRINTMDADIKNSKNNILAEVKVKKHGSLNKIVKSISPTKQIQKNKLFVVSDLQLVNNKIRQCKNTNVPSLDQQYKKKSKSLKLLQKIPEHRRLRSSSKIAQRLIQAQDFFHESKHHTQRDLNMKRSNTSIQYDRTNTQKQLQNMLQQKLKTQVTVNDSIPSQFMNFRDTKTSKFSGISRYTFGAHKKSKLSDLMTQQQINNSKHLIKQTEQMRKTQHILANAKQWQYHNCLILQNIQLYSTNLKLSCQGWNVLDHLQLKYLRGWNPKTEDDFSPMIRLFITKISYKLPQIAQYNNINMDTIIVRVNDKHIYHTDRDKQRQKGQKIQGIAPHTILSLRKLITAMLLTKNQDLIVHSVLALGFILKTIHQNIVQIGNDPLQQIKVHQKQYNIFIKSTETSTLQQYCQYFERQCENICKQLDLSSTQIIIGFSCLYKQFNRSPSKNKKLSKQHHQFTINSTPLDISIIFMKLLAYKHFKQTLSLRYYQPQVRHQVGWNFWETRTLKYINQQYVKYRLKTIGGRNNKNNQCYVVWDDKRDIIITMTDCKVNMHMRDTQRIAQWVQKHLGRFTKKYQLGLSFYKTDTEKFYKIK